MFTSRQIARPADHTWWEATRSSAYYGALVRRHRNEHRVAGSVPARLELAADDFLPLAVDQVPVTRMPNGQPRFGWAVSGELVSASDAMSISWQGRNAAGQGLVLRLVMPSGQGPAGMPAMPGELAGLAEAVVGSGAGYAAIEFQDLDSADGFVELVAQRGASQVHPALAETYRLRTSYIGPGLRPARAASDYE